MAPTTVKARDRQPRRGSAAPEAWPWIIIAAALAVRLAYLFQIRGTPITEVLLIDSRTYDRFARLILAGQFRGEEVYSMNLLYPYFLAGIGRIAGNAPFAALVVQTVLGALNAGLIYGLGRRLFDRPTAWVAGLMAAFYSPYVFYTGALLTPTLIETFVLLGLLLLAAWRVSRRTSDLLLAGLCTGLAALGRGSGLLLVGLAPLFFRVETGSWPRVFRPWAVFASAAMLLAGLATLRHAVVEKHFVPISANYAALYLGHNPQANGLYAMPDFVATADFEGEVTGVRKALSRQLGRELSQAEASAELFERGLRWAVTHPLEELGLTARKLYYFWNRTESPTNLSFDFAREFSALLRGLPLHWGIVAPLGLAGMIAARRRWREHLMLHLGLLVPLATCVLFFVSAEYRLPAAAVLILFAAHAVTRSAAWLMAKRVPAHPATKGAKPGRSPAHGPAPAWAREGWIALALLPLFFVACNVRTPLLRAQSLNRVAFYNHGVLYQQRGDLDRAENLLRRSLAIDPGYVPAMVVLSQIENQRGNTAEAMRYIEQARHLDPSIAAEPAGGMAPEDRLRTEAERLYQAQRFEEALAAFERARDQYLAAGRNDAATSMANNLGLTLFKLARYPEAERALRAIIAEQPDYVRAHTNLALVYEAQGRPEEALVEYRRALELEPGNRRARRAVERMGPGR